MILTNEEQELKRRLMIARQRKIRTIEDLTPEELRAVKRLLSNRYSRKAIGIIFSLSYSELKKITKL